MTPDSPQVITYEYKILTAMPQAIMAFRFIIENPEPLIHEMDKKIIQLVGELMMLQGFVKTYHFIFNPVMRGGVITGVCPFSLN